MSRTGHNTADTKAPVEPRINAYFTAIEADVNARFTAVQVGIDGIGEAYNQVAEGCTEIEKRLEALEHSNKDIRTRQHETTAQVKQVKGIGQKVDTIEFDIKTLINGRLSEHDKAIKDLQSQGSKDVDEVLQSVLLRLQKLEKAPSREKPQCTTTNLSTAALAQALLDRLKNGQAIEDEQLSRSLVTELFSNTTTTQPVRHMNTPPKDLPPEPRPAPEPEPEPIQQPQRKLNLSCAMPSTGSYRPKVKARHRQIQAARDALARKRKRASSKSGLPVDNEEGDARSAGMKHSRPLPSRPEMDEGVTVEEGFAEGEHCRRSGRAPKPAQLAAGTVSWAEARELKKQRLGRT
ncbi:hypothetical protein AC578_2106 [Pseudocercospora eumusae]|uniref:Uncharacterized protein n=1 Tax=Pseudocercospora eumusae TaxID=321146 RepID=A0A139HQH1_9PEZI|nr:hypothetical protein AC578_2106 [Pseudocercospora eumusae]